MMKKISRSVQLGQLVGQFKWLGRPAGRADSWSVLHCTAAAAPVTDSFAFHQGSIFTATLNVFNGYYFSSIYPKRLQKKRKTNKCYLVLKQPLGIQYTLHLGPCYKHI